MPAGLADSTTADEHDLRRVATARVTGGRTAGATPRRPTNGEALADTAGGDGQHDGAAGWAGKRVAPTAGTTAKPRHAMTYDFQGQTSAAAQQQELEGDRAVAAAVGGDDTVLARWRDRRGSGGIGLENMLVDADRTSWRVACARISRSRALFSQPHHQVAPVSIWLFRIYIPCEQIQSRHVDLPKQRCVLATEGKHLKVASALWQTWTCSLFPAADSCALPSSDTRQGGHPCPPVPDAAVFRRASTPAPLSAVLLPACRLIMGLTKTQRAFLQGMMSARVLSERRTATLYSRCAVEAAKVIGKEPPASATAVPDEEELDNRIGDINELLEKLHVQLRKGFSPADDGTFWGVVNTIADESSKLASEFSAPQVALFQAIVHVLLDDDQARMPLADATALGLALERNLTMKVSEASKAIHALHKARWLRQVKPGASGGGVTVTFGVRAVLELPHVKAHVAQHARAMSRLARGEGGGGGGACGGGGGQKRRRSGKRRAAPQSDEEDGASEEEGKGDSEEEEEEDEDEEDEEA